AGVGRGVVVDAGTCEKRDRAGGPVPGEHRGLGLRSKQVVRWAGQARELARSFIAKDTKPRIASAGDDEVFAAVVVDVDPTDAGAGRAEFCGESRLAGKVVEECLGVGMEEGD